MTITSDWTYKPDWWKITCNGTSAQAQIDSDTFKIHPDSTIYQVGGSDYKVDSTYTNVGGTQSNVTAWSCTNPDIAVNDFTTYRTDVPKTYTTKTVVNDSITSKENK